MIDVKEFLNNKYNNSCKFMDFESWNNYNSKDIFVFSVSDLSYSCDFGEVVDVFALDFYHTYGFISPSGEYFYFYEHPYFWGFFDKVISKYNTSRESEYIRPEWYKTIEEYNKLVLDDVETRMKLNLRLKLKIILEDFSNIYI